MYQIIFSVTEILFLNLDKLLLTAVSFLKSEENVFPANFVTPKGVWENVSPIKLWGMADGIAIGGRCYAHFE